MRHQARLSVLGRPWVIVIVAAFFFVFWYFFLTQHDSSTPTIAYYPKNPNDPDRTPKKILLTGAGGFIGSHTALALLERGDEVVIVDEMNHYYDVTIKEENLRLIKEKYGEDRVRIHIHDICDIKFMRELWEKEKFDIVCHLAARAGVRPSIEDPLIYVHSNVEGTTVLLELAKEFGIQHFVFASSSSVYGTNAKIPFSEDDLVENPVSPYAATKRMCELIAYTYHNLYHFPIAALRFFTVYGPRGRPDMAPYIFIDKIMHDQQIDQYGDGTSYRDYTYISDIVDGVIRSLDNPYKFEIYNLGRGDPINLQNFISLIERTVGKRAAINKKPAQPGDVPRTYASVDRARAKLGYVPKVTTEEGIRKTVEWFQQRDQRKQSS